MISSETVIPNFFIKKANIPEFYKNVINRYNELFATEVSSAKQARAQSIWHDYVIKVGGDHLVGILQSLLEEVHARAQSIWHGTGPSIHLVRHEHNPSGMIM